MATRFTRRPGRHPAAGAAAPFAKYIVVKELEKFGDNIIGVEILNEPNKVKPDCRLYSGFAAKPTKKCARRDFKQPIVAVGGAGPAGGGMAPGFAREIYKNARLGQSSATDFRSTLI